MMTKDELRDIKIGETLRKARPDFSVSEHLKKNYFGEIPISFMGMDILAMGSIASKSDKYYFFHLVFNACIDDAEKFWISMCYVKYKTPEFRNWDKYIDYIMENASKFNMMSEVASLLLRKS